MTTNSVIKLARIASGLTQEQAAKLTDYSIPPYATREKLPNAFTVDELKALYDGFNEQGKRLVWEYLESLFLC